MRFIIVFCITCRAAHTIPTKHSSNDAFFGPFVGFPSKNFIINTWNINSTPTKILMRLRTLHFDCRQCQTLKVFFHAFYGFFSKLFFHFVFAWLRLIEQMKVISQLQSISLENSFAEMKSFGRLKCATCQDISENLFNCYRLLASFYREFFIRITSYIVWGRRL